MVSFIPNFDLLPRLTRSRTPLPYSRPSTELRRWLAPQRESQRPLSAFRKPTLEKIKEGTGTKYPFKTVPAEAGSCTTKLWQTWNISDHPTETEEVVGWEDSSDESEPEHPNFFPWSDSELDEETDLEDAMTNIYKRCVLDEVVNEDSELWKQMSGCGQDNEDIDMNDADADTDTDDENGNASSETQLVRFRD